MAPDSPGTPAGLLSAGRLAGDDTPDRANAATPGAMWDGGTTGDLLCADCHAKCRARSLRRRGSYPFHVSDGDLCRPGNRRSPPDRRDTLCAGVLSLLVRPVRAGRRTLANGARGG